MFGLIDYLKLALGALAGLAFYAVYDRLIDDPLVRREALSGYVLKSERDALASQLDVERRRADAAAQTAYEFRKRWVALSESNRANLEKAEKAIADDTSDDGARVSLSDREWLRNHR